jgi:hypothetical protein
MSDEWPRQDAGGSRVGSFITAELAREAEEGKRSDSFNSEDGTNDECAVSSESDSSREWTIRWVAPSKKEAANPEEDSNSEANPNLADAESRRDCPGSADDLKPPLMSGIDDSLNPPDMPRPAETSI